MQNERELIDSINEFFGFEKDRITDAAQCGLWAASFIVNGIKYVGSVPYYGAKPVLYVVGYDAKTWKGTPISEEYYNNYIKDKPITILKCIDAEAGDWEPTDIIVSSEAAAIEFCQEHGQDKYGYDIYE